MMTRKYGEREPVNIEFKVEEKYETAESIPASIWTPKIKLNSSKSVTIS
jgi:hypothetical protein